MKKYTKHFPVSSSAHPFDDCDNNAVSAEFIPNDTEEADDDSVNEFYDFIPQPVQMKFVKKEKH